jgi:hypothetical protein
VGVFERVLARELQRAIWRRAGRRQFLGGAAVVRR